MRKNKILLLLSFLFLLGSLSFIFPALLHPEKSILYFTGMNYFGFLILLFLSLFFIILFFYQKINLKHIFLLILFLSPQQINNKLLKNTLDKLLTIQIDNCHIDKDNLIINDEEIIKIVRNKKIIFTGVDPFNRVAEFESVDKKYIFNFNPLKYPKCMNISIKRKNKT